MNFLSYFIFSLLIFIPLSAHAEREILVCGAPVEQVVETEVNDTYCNIYENQLAYKEISDVLRQQMIERQKSFAAPSLKTYEDYREKLRQIHASTPSDSE